MGFFRRAIEKRSNEVVDINSQEFLKILGIDANSISDDKLKESTYFTCMRIMTDSISKLPLKLYRETDNGTEKASSHALYKLLKLRPNQYMSSSDFWKMVEFQRLHNGHSVVYIDYVTRGRNAGKIKGLYPLNMDNVRIWIDDAGIIGKDNAIYYVYKDKKGNEYKLKHSEVLHFKGLTSDGITGMSVREYLVTTIENAQAGQKYVNNYFKGGLFAKGLLQYTGDISPENMKKMQGRFESMANGIKNAGKILPVPLGFSFNSISNSMADSQFLELNQFSIQNITSAFGVKMHQVNMLERATHNNIEHQMKEFYIDTLQSILTMYEQELNYKLLLSKELENGYFFRFNVDSILRSDIKTRYEAYRIGIQSGFLSINESRNLENLPSVDEGDTLICNGNMIPVKMAGNQYNNASEGGGTDD
ncbi:phage portal protein [Clostridium formicaceticum]|uniref:Phage portal protein n=1 Tax=Clostridium formicaceticum TaxID=1497 RepID=A0AAC9WH60_9CLOT|nr:phage portal protein [Clostridium formicaceticum]AOY76911.1 phage portal protein [Clostridium formicaceticum]ARE87390.1 Phage portal protein [Clostridium formicaceticum]